MKFKEEYKAVFSQVRPAGEFDLEEFYMKRPARSISRKVIVLAATVALLAGLCLTGYAIKLLGLRDLELTAQRVTEVDGEEVAVRVPTGLISLQGFGETPEKLALEEWQNFLGSYDDGGLLEQIGNGPTGLEEKYGCYMVYSQEMADKLEEIVEKYGLKLHTSELSDLYTDEALCDQVGGDFLGENTAGSTYMYEDGTFHFDGEIELEGYGNLDYQFMRCVRGSFTDVMLNIGSVNDYTEWTYTTANGVPVTLALASHKALIIVNLPDSFVTINVLAGTQTAEDDVFSSGPFVAEDLERFAESFDFSVLTPALPANPDLPHPSLAEVQGRYTDEEFLMLTGLEEADAQAFYAEFLMAIENGDRRAAAELLLYPACVTTEEGTFEQVSSAEEFLPYYDDIFTDSIWENIMNTRYDMERADLVANNGMVGGANGSIWFSLTEDGEIGVIAVQNAEGRSVRVAPTGRSYPSAREAYTAVLEDLIYRHILPDGTVCEPYDPMDTNKFALYDINGDGGEELILLFTNTYSADQAGYVLAYKEETGMLKTELLEFPMLTFYENGLVCAGWSHNQGRAGDSLWPYTLYRYNEDSSRYEEIARVDAWDRTVAETYMEQPFPAETDRSGTGVVYFIMTEGTYDISSPVDAADYEEWLASQIGDAAVLEIPYLSLTEEHIGQIREG